MTDSSPPLRRRGVVVQQTILTAALEELEERGFDSASVSGVADRAGVHETSIYRRFRTRENLFVEALLANSEDRVPVPDTGALRSDLVEALTLMCASVKSPLGLALLRTQALAGTSAYEEQRQRFWRARAADFLVMFERGVERGEISAGTDPVLALEMAVAPLHSRLLVTGRPIEEDLPGRIVDLLLGGLSPAPAAGRRPPRSGSG